MTASQAVAIEALDREALADLVEAIAARHDKAAFAALFQHFAPRIKGYLLRLGADRNAAEELAQEVMLTVWRKAATFDRTQASVSTWLFTIARNRRIDVIRRESRAELDPDDPMIQPAPVAAPDETVTALQREEIVRSAIEQLPQAQAEVLRYAFFQGKSHREISEETGLALGTVKSRIRLAFDRLREALDGKV